MSAGLLCCIYTATCLAAGAKALTMNRSFLAWFFCAAIVTPALALPTLFLLGPTGKSCSKCGKLSPLRSAQCERCRHKFSGQEMFSARLKRAWVQVD